MGIFYIIIGLFGNQLNAFSLLPVGVRHPLDGVFVVGQKHNGDAWDLPDPPLEVLIAGGHDVAFVLRHPVHEAVVGVRSFVHAGQPLEPRVLDNLERHPVLGPQLLQLAHDAVRDVGDALGVEAVHHALDHVHLVLDREVDEVGVDEDVIGRTQLGVVGEEEGGGALDGGRGLDLVWILFFGLLVLGRLPLSVLDPGIAQ